MERLIALGVGTLKKTFEALSRYSPLDRRRMSAETIIIMPDLPCLAAFAPLLLPDSGGIALLLHEAIQIAQDVVPPLEELPHLLLGKDARKLQAAKVKREIYLNPFAHPPPPSHKRRSVPPYLVGDRGGVQEAQAQISRGAHHPHRPSLKRILVPHRYVGLRPEAGCVIYQDRPHLAPPLIALPAAARPVLAEQEISVVTVAAGRGGGKQKVNGRGGAGRRQEQWQVGRAPHLLWMRTSRIRVSVRSRSLSAFQREAGMRSSTPAPSAQYISAPSLYVATSPPPSLSEIPPDR